MRLILVVDDDADTRDSIVDLLMAEGFDAIGATDGNHALSILAGPTLPHALLIDLLMPGMDGAALCEVCADNVRLASIPRVMISGARNERILECRAHAFVEKPATADRILRTLKEVLQPSA